MSTPLPGAGILGALLHLIRATLFLLCCFVMYRRENVGQATPDNASQEACILILEL